MEMVWVLEILVGEFRNPQMESRLSCGNQMHPAAASYSKATRLLGAGGWLFAAGVVMPMGLVVRPAVMSPMTGPVLPVVMSSPAPMSCALCCGSTHPAHVHLLS